VSINFKGLHLQDAQKVAPEASVWRGEEGMASSCLLRRTDHQPP